eukprot:358706-Chlamydomonas_euryale.AAC.4
MVTCGNNCEVSPHPIAKPPSDRGAARDGGCSCSCSSCRIQHPLAITVTHLQGCNAVCKQSMLMSRVSGRESQSLFQSSRPAGSFDERSEQQQLIGSTAIS